MVPQTVTVNSNHSGVTRLQGYSFEEDSGAAAQVELRKLDATGQIIAFINFAANESVTVVWPQAISSEGGVYVKEVSGSVAGVLYDAD